MGLKGYVFGWSAPTYVSSQQFAQAVQLAGGFDRSCVSDYHAQRYIAVVDELFRPYARGTERLFLRKLPRQNGASRYLIIQESHATHPVTERVVLAFALGDTPVLDYVHPAFPISRMRLQGELDAVTSTVCTASVLARVARVITRRGAVSLRKGGGAYFVPIARAELVDYTERVMAALGGSVMKFGVTGLDFELETIFQSFRDSFRMAVAELRRRASEAKLQRAFDTITREFQELMEIAELYRDILEGYQSELDDIIGQAKREIVQAIRIDSDDGVVPTSMPLQPSLSFS